MLSHSSLNGTTYSDAEKEPRTHDTRHDKLKTLPFAYHNPKPGKTKDETSAAIKHAEASALHLVYSLFPEWEQSGGNVEFEHFKDGITNTLIKAVKKRPQQSSRDADAEAVLIRAYGSGTEVLIDRERETTSHILLAKHDLAPPLLARFSNGLIYRFIQGQVCEPADLQKEPIWRGVAQRIAQWHTLLPVVPVDGHVTKADHSMETDLLSVREAEQMKRIAAGQPAPNLWTVMQKWIFALPSQTSEQQEQRRMLQVELDRSATELGATPGVINDALVFAHCDLLSGNVIVDEHQSENPNNKKISASVSFIDYEYANPAPAAFDLANHFSEWGGFECDYNVLPTRSVRRAFLHEYVKHCISYTSRNQSHDSATPYDESEFISKHSNTLFNQVDLFRGMPGFYWGIWALIQATISQIDFDYAAYAELRLAEYFAWRAEQDGSRVANGRALSPREERWGKE